MTRDELIAKLQAYTMRYWPISKPGGQAAAASLREIAHDLRSYRRNVGDTYDWEYDYFRTDIKHAGLRGRRNR